MAEHGLDLRPCPSPDLLTIEPPLRDDLLLRVRLDEDHGSDHGVRELVDLDPERMWQLLARQLEYLLADQLRNLHVSGSRSLRWSSGK